MITLRELGPRGLQDQIEEQDRAEMMGVGAASRTDIPGMRSPSALGVGGAVTRKTDAAQRIAIDLEQHTRLVHAEIYRKYNTDEGRRMLYKHVDTTRNVLQRTANALAVAYERAPVRTFERGTKKLERTWRDAVLVRGRFNDLAEQWARYAWITNVVHVIPRVQAGELVFDEILPHAADVIFDAGEREPSILVYLSDGGYFKRVAVDNERFWYLDENWAIVDEFAHGYRDLRGRPMQPWIQWRVRARMGTMDYWLRGVGRQLVDTTLKVAVVNAAMGAKRQAGNAKQVVLTARSIKDDVSAGQILSGEKPVHLREGAKLEALDLINPVADWLEQMDSDIEALAESYGVTRGAIDKTKSADRWHEFIDISRQREKQAGHLHRSDRETLIKAAIIMRADGHPDTGILDPKKIDAKLRVEFQQTTFLERPKDRYEAYEKARSLGLASPVEQYMLEHPNMDRAGAKDAQLATIEERNEIANKLAQHNLPADAGQDADNLAQLQGRLGGQLKSPPSNSKPDGGDDDQRTTTS